jgi:hypothetical protein
MKANRSFESQARPWVPPTITKLAIGTETKSPISADQVNEAGTNGPGAIVIVEPEPLSAPAWKFGFSLEWSFPLSARTD